MKKGLFLLICLLAGVLMICAACAEDAVLPAINDVLANLPDDIVEVQADLSRYSPLGSESIADYSSIEPKFLILQREMPPKELSVKVFRAPLEGQDTSGFDTDFEGTDIGEPRIWVRGDLMQQIPEDYRAKSLEEAGAIILAENVYICSGTLIITNYSQGNGEIELHEFESLEEMQAYLNEHQPEIESIEHYPVFANVMLIDFYDAKTGQCDISTNQFAFVDIPMKNKAAADQAANMEDLFDILLRLVADEVDAAGLMSDIADAEYIPEDTRMQWISAAGQGKYDDVLSDAYNTYWEMARALRDMDESEDNRNAYDMVIAEGNFSLLSMLISNGNYTSFDKPIDEIREDMSYLGAQDPEWYETNLLELVSEIADLF